MNNIINILNESKRRTHIATNITLEWQIAQNLLPQVINETTTHDSEFIAKATALREVLISMEENIQSIKSLIPIFEDK